MNLNAAKRTIAKALDCVGINAAGLALQKSLLWPFIRVVNYHDISPEHVSNFEAHLSYYSKHFINVDEKMLRGFLNGTRWPHTKPGLILTFDDGMRSHYEIAAPLLEKFDFTGWFFVPAGWIAERMGSNSKVADGERTLTLEQVRYLDQRHVVGCHTETHCRLTADVPAEKLQFEIMGSKFSFKEILGHDVNIFCWVGGEEFSYSKPAADLVKQDYDISFMTNNAVVRPTTNPLQIQRTNIEAENPLSLLRFQLSGLMDIIYSPKRSRVNRLTK
jgi:peptidoglycan/xylan/chitin deacetylase (PgdA/CDA1 family)